MRRMKMNGNDYGLNGLEITLNDLISYPYNENIIEQLLTSIQSWWWFIVNWPSSFASSLTIKTLFKNEFIRRWSWDENIYVDIPLILIILIKRIHWCQKWLFDWLNTFWLMSTQCPVILFIFKLNYIFHFKNMDWK